MKKIVEYMSNRGVIFRKLKEIKPKEIGSRKKVKIYLGSNINKYYCLIILISQKSKFLDKNALEIIDIHKKMEIYNDSKINIKYISIDAPLCSKAEKRVKEEGWQTLSYSSL